MNRREFIKSTAVAAGLVVVGVPRAETEDVQGTDFYVADWCESKDPPDRAHVVNAFRRAMKKHGFTRIYDLQYQVDYSIDRIAYLHVFSAKLI